MHVWIMVLLTLLRSGLCWAANELVDRESLRAHFGVSLYPSSHVDVVKVAVLDNGFMGYMPGGDLLPPSAQLLNLTSIGQAPTNHGLGMAQIAWAIAGQLESGPQFFLLNTNGYSNFKSSVQYTIDHKIDIVLYSQVWPFGGNFDGTGFINKWVTQATQAGVIWINAAGNYRNMVYNGPVKSGPLLQDVFLEFGRKDYLGFENRLDENPITITLSWNDFKDDENYNTNKDLDLFVYNQAGKLIASSELIQKGQAPTPGDSKLSSHARESITLPSLDRGKYQIKVRVKSDNFGVSDRLRVLIKSEKPDAVVFHDRSNGGEILPPADNALAITVGEQEGISSQGPTADQRDKPDTVVEDSTVRFTNGNEYSGSSTAAALLVGVIAVMKAEEPRLSLKVLRDLIRQRKENQVPTDLKSAEFAPVNGEILNLIPPGGKLMIHKIRNHFVVLTPQDPFLLEGPKSSGIARLRPDDHLVYASNTKKWLLVPHASEPSIKSPLVEFRQLGSGSKVWKTPTREELHRMFNRG